jgi:hypothetical protein
MYFMHHEINTYEKLDAMPSNTVMSASRSACFIPRNSRDPVESRLDGTLRRLDIAVVRRADSTARSRTP